MFARKADAQRFLNETETAKARGTWTDPALGRVLFRDWLGEWWATITNLRPKTRDRDELLLRRLALPSFGAVPLAAISQRDVRVWVADLTARGLAPATVLKAYQLLGKVMGAAVDAGMLAQSPCRRVPLPKVEREEMRFLTPAEVATLADAIKARYRALVLVGAYGGLRIGELAGLRRGRVDLLRGTVTVAEIVVEVRGVLHMGPPKTRASRRTVGLPRFVAEELAAHLAGQGDPDAFVFTAPQGDPLRVTAFRARVWRPATRAAGLDGLRIHDLELKVPGQEGATLRGAWNQLRTYAAQIPGLLAFNAVSIISTGTQARLGALGGRFEHYAPWKTIDGSTLAPAGLPELEVLVRGVFPPAIFLDLVRNYIAFSDERAGLVKRVAKYHQFYAVNRAVAGTVAAMGRGDGRAGVVWHTQGSGKSLEMLFYVGKIMREPAMANPTAVLLTDRNDLDDQLFDEVFAPSRTLPETPVQATSREHVRQLLASKASGGIVFSTMQKFGLTKEDRDAGRRFPLLSDRQNIVVIADEAHRTQYDLIDGLARNLRDAIPNAAFIGFTGTPIEAADRNTRAIFGEYIDVYDLSQAVEDGATVRVYYEARLAKVELPEEARAALDTGFEDVTELAEVETREKLKTRWARVEAVVGVDKRVAEVAADIVEHWEKRRDVLAGKP